MTNLKKIIIGALALTLLGVGCSQNKAPSNAWHCQYGGGPIDTQELKKTVAPGERGGWSVFDESRIVPAGVRTYILDEDPSIADVGAKPLVLPAKGRSVELPDDVVEEAATRLARTDGIAQVSIELQARFVINENACELDNNHLKSRGDLNFDAGQGEESAWASFLNESWNQKMTEAARPVIIEYDWLQLNTNSVIEVDGERAQVFEILSDRISENLTRELRADLGGDYFCGPSYAFDGKVDGEFEDGCPQIEITIKEIKPINDQLIDDYQAIVANIEAQERILSDKDREITQLNADRDKQLATEENRRIAEIEIARNDREIAQEQAETLTVLLENAQKEAQADAAYCAELAKVGIDCALLQAAERGAYPNIVIGDSGANADVSLLVGADN